MKSLCMKPSHGFSPMKKQFLANAFPSRKSIHTKNCSMYFTKVCLGKEMKRLYASFLTLPFFILVTSVLIKGTK